MKRSLDVVAVLGLVLGGVLGIAGTLVQSPHVRDSGLLLGG